jgi:hypothetical protein
MESTFYFLVYCSKPAPALAGAVSSVFSQRQLPPEFGPTFKIFAYSEAEGGQVDAQNFGELGARTELSILNASSKKGSGHGFSVLAEMALLCSPKPSDYFVFLNADTSLLLPNALKEMTSKIEGKPGISVVWGAYGQNSLEAPEDLWLQSELSGSLFRANLFMGVVPKISPLQLEELRPEKLLSLNGAWTDYPTTLKFYNKPVAVSSYERPLPDRG